MRESAEGNGVVVPASVEQLRDDLRVLISALTVGEGTAEVTSLLAGLRTTADDLESTLLTAEPVALKSVRVGLEHAVAGEYDESRSEFLAAFRRLSVLLQRAEDV